MKNIQDYVLRALKPEVMGGAPLEEPGFLNDSQAWETAMLYAASVHARLPFVAAVSRASWKESMPEVSQLRLAEILSRERMVLALLDQELQDSVFALIAAKIPVMVLKGMDVGRRFYPDRIFRPMADVDLLVPAHLFLEALKALGRAGYRVSGPFPEGRFRVELIRGKGHLVVELHKGLIAGDTPEHLARLWDRAIDGSTGDLPRAVRVLHPEDLLVYLIRHGGVQHLLESPVWMNDIHFLISSQAFRDSVRWDQVVDALVGVKAVSAAWFILRFLAQEWGAPVPPEVLKQLGARLGMIRRRWLMSLATPEVWFPLEGRSATWVARSRFLLRDNAIEAIKYGLGRRAPVTEAELRPSVMPEGF